jgi:hypothetical protein
MAGEERPRRLFGFADALVVLEPEHLRAELAQSSRRARAELAQMAACIASIYGGEHDER